MRSNKLQAIIGKLEQFTLRPKQHNSLQRSLSQQSHSNNHILNNRAGVPLTKGDIVETATKGRFFENNARIKSVNGDRATIEYSNSKQLTWRLDYNMFKVDKGLKGSTK